MPFFYANAMPCVRNEKEACEVEERQALLPADKTTLAGETTEALPSIDIQQHHGGEARSATLLSDNSDISESFNVGFMPGISLWHSLSGSPIDKRRINWVKAAYPSIEH